MTEEVTGLDLVALQLADRRRRDAGRASACDRRHVPAPRGVAMQARVNLETMAADGRARPGGGVLTAYEPPSGPGRAGRRLRLRRLRDQPRYDSLLAKVIVHAAGRPGRRRRQGRRALGEFRIAGRGHQHRVPAGPARATRRRGRRAATPASSRSTLAELLAAAGRPAPRLYFDGGRPAPRQRRAGAKVDAGRSAGRAGPRPDGAAPRRLRRRPGRRPASAAAGRRARRRCARRCRARWSARRRPGDAVRRRPAGADHGSHEDGARDRGARSAASSRADRVGGRRHGVRGPPLIVHRAAATSARRAPRPPRIDLEDIRPDLAEVLDRHGLTLDAAPAGRRRQAAAARPASAPPGRTSTTCVDPGTFVEYGAADDRGAARAGAADGGADRADPGRRHGDRRRPGSTATCSARARPARGDGLRLHRAGRHPGRAKPPEDGPDARARRAVAAADRLLLPRAAAAGPATPTRRPAAPHLGGLRPDLAPAHVGAGAARRHHLRPLLRRQRLAAGLLRRDHRHRGLAPSAWAARR